MSFNSFSPVTPIDYLAQFRSYTDCVDGGACDLFLSTFSNRPSCLPNQNTSCNYNVHDDSFPMYDLPFSCNVPINSSFDALFQIVSLPDPHCVSTTSYGSPNSITFTVTCCEEGDNPIFTCEGGPCHTSDPITISLGSNDFQAAVDLALECNCMPELK